MHPVVHHIELCVGDAAGVLKSLKKFGFQLHGRRETPVCQQWVTKVGGVACVVSQRQRNYVTHSIWKQDTVRAEPLTVLCCEDQHSHRVDTVFNVALIVKNVKMVTERIKANGGSVIQPPTVVQDEFGQLSYSIVRSCSGNVVHTLVNKDDYKGAFLPGFEMLELDPDCGISNSLDKCITHIDHVTLACYPGDSQSVISWYETCFGMQRFSINRDDDNDEGLILEGGVGLRLKAMEYWRCAETGLIYPSSSNERQRNPNSFLLVVVESLPGQTNCNVETYLREHEGPGVEHIAFSTPTMVDTVSKMVSLGVNFRQPPAAYYNQLKKVQQIQDIGHDLEALQRLGVLLDNELDSNLDEPGKPRYLMQIFAHPLFSRKTCFIEVIQRCGARGLGAGNILALVRSIREEEAKKKTKQAALEREEYENTRQLY